MAARSWGGAVATAIGVAAGLGAAQLGFGYGLGIVNWAPAGAGTTEATWFASLAWATWVAAVSTVGGAVCAQRLYERGEDTEPGGGLQRVTLAVAAAVGGLITVLLVAVPARAAVVPGTFSPQSLAAGYAGLGVLVGLLAAVWALRSRAAAHNIVGTVGWLWLLAVVSVVDGVLAGRGVRTAQLGIWQISADRPAFWLRDYLYLPGALLAAGSALVIGALAARRTARLPHRRLGAAVSGAAGPLLVAIAYLLAVPRLATIAPEQVSAHLVAPYAVIVGAAGSLLVAALAQRAEQRRAVRDPGPVPRQRTGGPDDRGALDAPAGRPPAAPVRTGAAGSAADGPATRGPSTSGTAASGAKPGRPASEPVGGAPATTAEPLGAPTAAEPENTRPATGRARPPLGSRTDPAADPDDESATTAAPPPPTTGDRPVPRARRSR
ncbi:hypothetical protein ACFY3U_07275 [Micromonospora sp. NPDC000089]|uniref:hypothetical protein n=1 Tax=unclassified Micromonospora TaxID=2617518 RepID=UPI0036CF6390